MFVTKLILRYLNHYAFLRLKNKSSTIAAAAVILAINISCSKTLSEALSLDLMSYNKCVIINAKSNLNHELDDIIGKYNYIPNIKNNKKRDTKAHLIRCPKKYLIYHNNYLPYIHSFIYTRIHTLNRWAAHGELE